MLRWELIHAQKEAKSSTASEDEPRDVNNHQLEHLDPNLNDTVSSNKHSGKEMGPH